MPMGMCGLPGLRTGVPDRIANRVPWIKQPPPPACAPGGVPARMAPIVYRRAAMRNTARSTAIGTATAWALALTAAAGSAASQQAAPRADALPAPTETVTAQG